MSLVALELHDAGVTAVAPGAGGSEPRILGAPSPGFALLEGETLWTGPAARERRRLAPRRAHHRFWHTLDAHQALPRPFPQDWTAADLAHAHLEGLWQEIRSTRGRTEGSGNGNPRSEDPERVILAVPGSFEPEQLGLLLGICRAAGIPVAGLVDLALAAAAQGDSAHRLLHFDLHLHRGVITELRANASGELVRRSVRAAEGVGRVTLEDLWAHAAAGAFVHATRFDPLHDPHTEQALYHRLAPWLESLEETETAPLTLELGGEPRTVELSRERAVAAVEDVYRRLVEPVRDLASAGEPPVLLLSHHATGLPGLTERLEAAGISAIEPLSAGAAGRGALTVRTAIPQDAGAPGGPHALPLILRLPLPAASEAAIPGPLTGAPDGAP